MKRHATIWMPMFVALAMTAPATAQETQRHALLIGCTKYPYARLQELAGPANDVKMMRDLLIARFGFPQENVHTLVGWPEDERARPTHANISAALKDLAARATPASQIVVLLAGHGTQAPIPAGQDPLDADNFEPDGMDEYFLPADVAPRDEGSFKNGLIDDEMGRLLRALTDRGAAVWVIFDSCHSGTMTRSAAYREVPRQAKPEELGISKEAVRAAVQRGRDAVQKAGKTEHSRGLTFENGALTESMGRRSKGSLVAFYAAQPFEETPETLRPEDAPDIPANYYGLFSSTIVQVLSRTTGPLTYRDLSRKVLAVYAAERAGRGPTPFVDGDTGNVVLGAKALDAASDIVVRHGKGKLTLNVGILHGMTPGSVLALLPPAGEKGEIGGYVTILRSNPFEADVAPCRGPDGTPAIAAKDVKALARCRLVSQDLGDMRLKVAVRAAAATDVEAATGLLAALEGMNKDIRALWTLAKSEGEADWLLWVESGKVRIRSGAGQNIDLKEKAAAEAMGKALAFPAVKEYGDYNLVRPAEVAQHLERDLQAIYTWQNLWRISGLAESQPGGLADLGLKLDVLLLDDKGKEIGPIQSAPRLHAGQPMRLVLRNDGYKTVWFTLLSMSGDCGIGVIASDAGHSLPLQQGKTFTLNGHLKEETWGKEGIIVLAVPLKDAVEPPNFAFLEQKPLQRLRSEIERGGDLRKEVARKLGMAPRTPFTNLLRTATLGQGGTRGFEPQVETNPTILAQAWLTMPVVKGK